MAMNEHHMAPTSFQAQHVNAAMNDHNSYFKSMADIRRMLAVATATGGRESSRAIGIQ